MLAGCLGGSGEPIKVTAPAEPGGAWTFEASGSADSFTWDLGDQLTVLEGKMVTHTYDITDGTLIVAVTLANGEETVRHETTIVLGTGINENGAYVMEVEREWPVTGELFRLSGALSTDPEGDAIRYKWRCDGPIALKRVDPHDDGLPPSTLQPPKPGAVTAGTSNRTLPAADLTLDGDFCTALTALGPTTEGATVAGTFAAPGQYLLSLQASDGAHPTTSGSFVVWVTPPEERPDPIQRQSYSGTIPVPVIVNEPSIRSLCPLVMPDEPCDQATHFFDVPVALLGGWVNLTVTAGPQDPAGAPLAQGATWELYNGDNLIASGGPGSTSFPAKPTTVSGSYKLTVIGASGANIAYDVTFAGLVDMDPKKLYERA